jgi:hypothetical protein
MVFQRRTPHPRCRPIEHARHALIRLDRRPVDSETGLSLFSHRRMCTFRAYVMARAPVGTTGPGTGVQSTFDRSRLLHQRKSEASIADSVSVRVPPSCAAFVEVPALGGAVLALPGCIDLLATRARCTDPRRTAVASASLETNITWLTDTSRAAGTASPARRRGAARSPRRELRTPPARAVPAPTANSQPSPSV